MIFAFKWQKMFYSFQCHDLKQFQNRRSAKCLLRLYCICNERQLYIVGARPCWAPESGRQVGVRGDSEIGEDAERTSYRLAFDIYHYIEHWFKRRR